MTLDPSRRAVVERTIAEVCAAKQWVLGAITVRAEHVHVVVAGQSAPESMMNAFKAWSTRRMREEHLIPPEHRVWARHGSTRYLTQRGAIEAACAYVNRHNSEG